MFSLSLSLLSFPAVSLPPLLPAALGSGRAWEGKARSPLCSRHVPFAGRPGPRLAAATRAHPVTAGSEEPANERASQGLAASRARPAGPVSRGPGLAFLPPARLKMERGLLGPPCAAARPRPRLSSWDRGWFVCGELRGWLCPSWRPRVRLDLLPRDAAAAGALPPLSQAGDAGCPRVRAGMEGVLAWVGPAGPRPCSAPGFCGFVFPPSSDPSDL